MNKTLMVSFLIVIVSWGVKAQELPSYSPNNYSVIPPSPEVSALMEYIDFPVSHHTGLPDITLPIYVVKEGTLEVPVSISYHGGGAKVNKVEGIIAKDWNLNAGGSVARYVRGLPDEINKLAIHGLFSINNPDRINEKNLRNEYLNRNFDNIYNPIPSIPSVTSYILPYTMCGKFNEGRMDMASDIYQMNFLGKQGTFAINPNDRNIVLNTPSHLKAITTDIPELGGECSFVDEMQNKYYFCQQEQSCFNYSYLYGGTISSDTIHYNSAWHLTKVTSPQQDSIMFEYIYAGEKIVSLGYSKSETTVSQTNSSSPTYTIYGYYPHTVQYYPRLLHKIKNRSTEVVFVYDNNSEKLTEIDIYRRSVPQELLKRFVLNRETILIAYSNINGANQASYMTVLKSIDEIGSDNTTVRMYEFNYYTFPDTISGTNYHDAIDHWGYYNGYTSNTVYHPAFGGRETNERATMGGTLASIQYPTGGLTMFDWEQNDYGYLGDIPTGGHVVNETQTNISRLYGNIQNMSQLNSTSVLTNQFDRTLYVTKPTDHTRRITIDVRTFMGNLINSGNGMANCADYFYHHNQTDLNTTAPRVELISPSNTLLQVWFIDQYQCSQTPLPVELTEGGNYQVKLRYPYNWMTGVGNSFEPQTVYNYLAPGGTENSNGDNGYISITQTDIIPSYEPNPRWGGLRIKKISSVSEYLCDAIEKNYSYIQTWGNPASSGVVLEHPKDNYQSAHHSCKMDAMLPSTQMNYQWTIYSTSHSDALYGTPSGGSHIEYSTVYEWFTGDSAVTRYDFTSQRNIHCRDKLDCNFPSYINGGAEMRTSYRHRSGDLTARTVYIGNKIVNKESYQYNIHENNAAPLFLDGLHPLVNIDDCNISIPNVNDIYSSDYVACRYKIIPYTKTVSSKTTEEYDQMSDETTIPYLSSTINYTHFMESFDDDPSATFVRSESHQNSDGALYETFYSYVNINGHYINLPETEVTTCDGLIVKAKKYVYDDKCRLIATYRSPTNIPIRNEYCLDTYCYGASQPLLSAINLPEFGYKYNPWGELVEVDYNGKVLSSFIWAYRGSHPVAEVKGVSYDELMQASPDGLFILDLHNRYDISESELDAIRQAFPSNEVVTLTYDWLVGVGTMTSPNGVTTKFSYDGLGRLASIRDLNDYYIKRFEYHYAD